MGASVCKTIRAMLSGDCPKISRGLKLDSIPSWQAYIDPFFWALLYDIWPIFCAFSHILHDIWKIPASLFLLIISVFIVWGPSSINRLVPSALFTILSDKILPLVKLTCPFEVERKKYFRWKIVIWKGANLHDDPWAHFSNWKCK